MTYSMFGCESAIAQICLVSANNETGGVFGISEYLSACAILFVVLTVSDFRYRFRLEISAFGRKFIFGSCAVVGFFIALSEVWFANSWPVPPFANNLSVIQACLGGAFIFVVLYAGWVVFIHPPKFSELNATRFAYAYLTHIGAGDRTQLAVLAIELRGSVKAIFEQALQVRPGRKPRNVEQIAWELTNILGDKRFCRALAESGAWTIEEIFLVLSSMDLMQRLPVVELTTNISAELLRNTSSPLVTELEAYSYGYFEDIKPIAGAVYGNAKLLEALSAYSGPLDLWRTIGFKAEPTVLENYSGALQIFCQDYFKNHKQPQLSSRILRTSLEHLGQLSLDLYLLDKAAEPNAKAPELTKLDTVVRLITSIVRIMDEQRVDLPQWYNEAKNSIHHHIAKQCVEVIFHASAISGPAMHAWNIHHNTVWRGFFEMDGSKTASTVQRLARRIVFDEIRKMESYPNYRGARLLGFILSIYGLSEGRYHVKRHHALKPAILNWTRRNYLRIRRDYPDVADAVLIGSITFDESRNILVKTYAKNVRSEPAREYLALEPAWAN